MPKKPDERIVQAKQMFLDGIKLVEIASQLKLPEGTVRRWKSTHKWENERSDKKDANVRKRGAQPGNHNATGPPRNQNARKHGLFSKYLPPELCEIIGAMPDNYIDALYDQIQILYANIMHSQKILYVEDKGDKTKDVSMKGDGVIAYDIQQAWDKQASNMSALSRSMKTLQSMIKEYDALIHKNWDHVTNEQKARLELINAQITAVKSKVDNEEEDNYEDDGFLEALGNTSSNDWENYESG